jgi:hypothetical protein
MLPQPISLTTEEEALVKEIVFDLNTLSPGFHEQLQRSCTAGGKLARSLLMRRAIPEIRYRYFTDPELNTGRRLGSRKNNFERNGTKGDAILEHGHFLPYLRYFIFGPNLPQEVMTRFAELVEDDAGAEVFAFVRSAVRQLPRERRLDAPEEFFKLAIELGMEPYRARSVRDAAMQARR